MATIRLLFFLAALILPSLAFAQEARARPGKGIELSVVARRTSVQNAPTDHSLAAQVTIPLEGAASPRAGRVNTAMENAPAVDAVPPADERAQRSVTRVNDGDAKVLAQLIEGAARTAGIDEGLARIRSLMRRERAAAALPIVVLRAGRTSDLRSTASTDDLGTVNEDATATARLFYEARLTFRLDRIAAADDEATLERFRADLLEKRGKLAREVTTLFGRLRSKERAFAMESNETQRNELRDELHETTLMLVALCGVTPELLRGP